MKKSARKFCQRATISLLCLCVFTSSSQQARADAWEILVDSLFPILDDYNIQTQLNSCMNQVANHLNYTAAFYCKSEEERPSRWRCVAEEAAFDAKQEICARRYKKLEWVYGAKPLAMIPVLGGLSTNEHNVQDALACCTELQAKAEAFRACVKQERAFFRTNCDSGTVPPEPVSPISDDEICNG